MENKVSAVKIFLLFGIDMTISLSPGIFSPHIASLTVLTQLFLIQPG
jgi:hypothetical protein